MKSWRLWLPAVAVLLLGMDGVYMEDMRAENIDLLTPTDYNRVLNLGMRGIYWLLFLIHFFVK